MKEKRKRTPQAMQADPALLAIAARTNSIRLEAIEALFHVLKLGRRQTLFRQILRWFVDNTVYNPETRRDECIYHAAAVAGSIWVDCTVASVRAAVAYWRSLKIVCTERRSTPGGGKLPPRAWIDWRAVVSRCGGRVSDRGAVRGVPSAAPAVAAGRPGSLPAALAPLDEDHVPGAVPVVPAAVAPDCSGAAKTQDATCGGPGPSLPPLGGAASPTISAAATGGGPSPSCAPLDPDQPHSDGGPSPSSFSLPGGLVSMAVILAAARAVCSDTDSVTVTDPDDVDDSLRNSIRIRNVVPRRSAQWTAVRRLAAKAAALVHNGRAPADPRLRQTYLAAAAAALTLFRTPTPGQWLLSAAQCVADRRQSRSQGPVFNPIRYLMGVLRRQCSLLAIDVREDSEAEKDAAKTWFAGVMRPFEVAVELQCAAAVPAVASSPKPPVTAAARATAPSAEEWGAVAIELGLPPDASTAAIADAYRRRAVAAHCPAPGQGGDGDREKALESAADLEKGGAERQRETRAEGGGRKAAGEPAIACAGLPPSPFRPPP